MTVLADDDLAPLAPGLVRDESGVWHAARRRAVDYPDEGHGLCFDVEDASFWFRHRNACIVQAVRRRPPSGGPIIDVGGGNGVVARALEQAGFPTIVVEPGRTGIENARRRGLPRLVHAAFEEVAFRPASLAAVGLFDVLEHIPDERGCLDGIAAALAPGGRLYVTVPAYETLWSAEDDVAGHHRRYHRARLARALAGSGFIVEDATYLFAIMPLPILLLRTLPDRLRRRELTAERVQASLKPTENVVTHAIDWLLRRELAHLERGGRLSFGSSVLAVARRR